ncbi:Na+/H+ antiporter NhaC, partial [candidate division KSB1 bacterium]|nr:Na+/H+ antiporter NhaC [candidate division KSB1 bacterium]
MSHSDIKREPTLFQTILPIAFLITLLTSSVYLFGADSSYGPNQIALILSAGIGIIIGIRNGYTWRELEQSIVQSISLSMGAILILLVVGSLIGTWILSGIVPTMIYYGLKILNPTFFYPLTAIICAVVALATGSSWTTASTIGIALIGIATALQLDLAITAGAIISGSYFGDKLSPLSDTTNLAPAVAGTDLFTHIRHMVWTTFPSITIAITLYLIIGFTSDINSDTVDLSGQLDLIRSNFTIGVYLLFPLVVVFALAVKKNPAFPTLVIGTLTGVIMALIFQQDVIDRFAGANGHSEIVVLLDGVWRSLFAGYTANTGNTAMDELLTQGGMAGMLDTIWLIMCAITFGSIMEKFGLLKRLVIGL